MGSFSGRICMVTGGASGIAKALGAELSRRGAAVIITDINSGIKGTMVKD